MSEDTKTLVGGAAEAAALLEKVIVGGDLSRLSSAERLAYYERVCTSVGLNPFTQPFAYLNLKGRGLVLYAQKGATDQLRSLHGISVDKVEVTYADDLVIVTVVARSRDGRSDSDVGCVPLGRLQGEDRANAIMKAVTKAKRRTTLSICGLGMLDETEVESIPEAVREPAPVQPVPHVVRVRPEGATLDRVAAELAGDTGAEATLPGQGRPPKVATVDGTRRNELFAKIQALAGKSIDSGERWKELARAYDLVEPDSRAALTVGWMEELYRRMCQRQMEEGERAGDAPPARVETLEQVLAGQIAAAEKEDLEEWIRAVIAHHEGRHISDAAYEALNDAIEARSGELDLYPQATGDGRQATGQSTEQTGAQEVEAATAG